MSDSISHVDLIIVGSGPSGSIAALTAIEGGAKVVLIDYGADDPESRLLVPDRSFSEIRSTDSNQSAYFIGRQFEGVPTRGIKVGAQLTPPRQFVSANADSLLPIVSDTFFPMQSTSLGGLGAAWGAACLTYNEEELKKIGLNPVGFQDFYDQVACEIGISGPTGSSNESPWWSGVTQQMPTLRIDSNAEAILNSYAKKGLERRRRGFYLGHIPLAVLSQDKGDRRSNPYFDMDFYSDSRKSVFRPRYIIESLEKSPLFNYRKGLLAIRFEESTDFVRLYCLRGNRSEVVEGRRLLICAGAINSGRLALNSIKTDKRETTLLCNGYTYLPTINRKMIGRKARDERYSLAQLHAMLQDGPALDDNCSVQIYSYRSLLMFKLVKEMPLPPWLGLQFARSIATSLAICGVFHSDYQTNQKMMRLTEVCKDRMPRLDIIYRPDVEQMAKQMRLEGRLASELRKVHCYTLKRISPGLAGSIHYAGTLPFSNPLNAALSTEADFRLSGHKYTYVGDSSSWRWLPSKGLTFTVMASARRITQHVLATL